MLAINDSEFHARYDSFVRMNGPDGRHNHSSTWNSTRIEVKVSITHYSVVFLRAGRTETEGNKMAGSTGST